MLQYKYFQSNHGFFYKMKLRGHRKSVPKRWMKFLRSLIYFFSTFHNLFSASWENKCFPNQKILSKNETCLSLLGRGIIFQDIGSNLSKNPKSYWKNLVRFTSKRWECVEEYSKMCLKIWLMDELEPATLVIYLRHHCSFVLYKPSIILQLEICPSRAVSGKEENSI